MGHLIHVAAAVFHNVDLIAVIDGLDSGESDARLGPQTGQDDLLLARFFDCGDKVLVVP